MIDRETIDRVFAAANIVEIVGDYVTLKRKGVNYMACCPFHNEKTPSFVVSPAKGLFKCFGCGKGGNAITFVMEQENVQFPEAIKIIAKRYGIQIQERELSDEEIKRNDDRESMFVVNGWAADYFQEYLHSSEEGRSVALPYFSQRRGFTDSTIRKFSLGFCAARGSLFSKAALSAGYKEEFLISTGLSKRSERDGSLYDVYRDRVIFPIHNISGRVVGFGGRVLGTPQNVGKYINSPENEIYSKRREIYGLYFAKRAIQQQDVAIMVEGYTDVISMHQAGVENVVASSGTSLTVEQIRLLRRFSKNITIIYDSDNAGIKASLRGIDLVLAEGMNVRVVLLPEGEDPDSFARSHSSDEVRAYILDHEVDFITFKAQLLMRDVHNDPIKRADLVNDMIQSISQIPESVYRSVYVKECARIMDVDENVLLSEIARIRHTSVGDRESQEFIRRQAAQMRQETHPQSVQVGLQQGGKDALRAGSSADALEAELIKYLLKWGHCSVDIVDTQQVSTHNIADLIISGLEVDGLSFQNPVYNEILETYSQQWRELGMGVEVPSSVFVNHHNPDVSVAAVDILTSDDNYVPSSLWKMKDIHIESESELLSQGVPRAILLYKSKAVERMERELNLELQNPDIDDEHQSQLLQRLMKLHQIKVQLAKNVDRLIL